MMLSEERNQVGGKGFGDVGITVGDMRNKVDQITEGDDAVIGS